MTPPRELCVAPSRNDLLAGAEKTGSVTASEQKNETLMIYGFSFEYPASAKIEFNPKFTREAGDVAVKFPRAYNTFVSWGNLEKLRKKLPTVEEHAKYSLEAARKNLQGKLTTVEKTLVNVNGHDSEYNHIRVDISRRGLFGSREQVQEMRSLHLHCPDSSRYFVIYGSTDPENAESQRQTVGTLIRSLRCH